MHVETVRDLHEYNDWATERILDCAAAIATEQFVAENETPWGSIRNQLVHVVDVHRRWLNWADGTMSGEEAYKLSVDMDDCPDISSVRSWWEEVRAQNQRFMDRLTEDDLTRELSVSGPNASFSIPTWRVMTQIAFHGMQHRSETAMVLTRLGQSPGDIDYIFYSFQKSASGAS